MMQYSRPHQYPTELSGTLRGRIFFGRRRGRNMTGKYLIYESSAQTDLKAPDEFFLGENSSHTLIDVWRNLLIFLFKRMFLTQMMWIPACRIRLWYSFLVLLPVARTSLLMCFVRSFRTGATSAYLASCVLRSLRYETCERVNRHEDNLAGIFALPNNTRAKYPQSRY